MKISKYDTVEHTVNIIKESNLIEMAMDRNKAIAVCMQLGDEFIEHFHKVYLEGVNSINFNHHCSEMTGWYKRVKRIVLSNNKKQISVKQLEDWFFCAGSSYNKLFNNYEEIIKYKEFVKLLLKNTDTRISDILKCVLEWSSWI